MGKKPIIIFDTDMDTDCDDAGALLMLVKAHLSGQIELKGVVADSLCEYAAPFCKEILDYYSLDIPVGEIYGHIFNDGRFNAYLEHQKECTAVAYNRIITKANNLFCNSTELYSNILKNAPDKSITVLCVGMLSAVSAAIKVDPWLFDKKVERVVVMGNPYKRNDFNFAMDAKAAKEFFELCPCPVAVSYTGSDIITGNLLNSTCPQDHPVRRAYQIWSGGKGRSSWDLIAALYAMNPTLSVFKVTGNCCIEYDSKEKIALIKDGTRDSIIGLNCTNATMENMLNALLG